MKRKRQTLTDRVAELERRLAEAERRPTIIIMPPYQPPPDAPGIGVPLPRDPYDPRYPTVTWYATIPAVETKTIG